MQQHYAKTLEELMATMDESQRAFVVLSAAASQPPQPTDQAPSPPTAASPKGGDPRVDKLEQENDRLMRLLSADPDETRRALAAAIDDRQKAQSRIRTLKDIVGGMHKNDPQYKAAILENASLRAELAALRASVPRKGAAPNDDEPREGAAPNDDEPREGAAPNNDESREGAALKDGEPRKEAALENDEPRKEAALEDNEPRKGGPSYEWSDAPAADGTAAATRGALRLEDGRLVVVEGGAKKEERGWQPPRKRPRVVALVPGPERLGGGLARARAEFERLVAAPLPADAEWVARAWREFVVAPWHVVNLAAEKRFDDGAHAVDPVLVAVAKTTRAAGLANSCAPPPPGWSPRRLKLAVTPGEAAQACAALGCKSTPKPPPIAFAAKVFLRWTGSVIKEGALVPPPFYSEELWNSL